MDEKIMTLSISTIMFDVKEREKNTRKKTLKQL